MQGEKSFLQGSAQQKVSVQLQNIQKELYGGNCTQNSLFVTFSQNQKSKHRNVNSDWCFICHNAYRKIKSIKRWHVVNKKNK